MPHLLNFLKGNGSLLTNDHTILISHTAGGILSDMTGLYPDRTGRRSRTRTATSAPTNTPAFSRRSSTGPTRSTVPTTACRTWSATGSRRSPRRGSRSRMPAATSAASRRRTSSSRTPRRPTIRRHDPRLRRGLAGVERRQGVAARTGEPDAARTGRLRRHRRSIARRTRRSATTRTRGRTTRPIYSGSSNGYKALFGAKYVNPAITKGKPCVNDMNGAADHGSVRAVRLPGLRRGAREEHARHGRADAGERRAGHVRVHLGRARQPRDG